MEEYVEEFLSICYHATCSDITQENAKRKLLLDTSWVYQFCTMGGRIFFYGGLGRGGSCCQHPSPYTIHHHPRARPSFHIPFQWFRSSVCSSAPSRVHSSACPWTYWVGASAWPWTNGYGDPSRVLSPYPLFRVRSRMLSGVLSRMLSRPVFIKPLRITLKNTAKNWLKCKKDIGSKLRLKVSYQASQS